MLRAHYFNTGEFGSVESYYFPLYGNYRRMLGVECFADPRRNSARRLSIVGANVRRSALNLSSRGEHFRRRVASTRGAMRWADLDSFAPDVRCFLCEVVIISLRLREGARNEYDIPVCDFTRRNMRRFSCNRYDKTVGVTEDGGRMETRNQN